VPTARFSNTLAANEVVQNIMAGSQFEFVGRPSRIQIYSVADLADIVQLEAFFGQELQASPSNLPQTTAGFGPAVPDDLLVDDIAAPGDRITIRLTETAGAAGITRSMVVITPVA